MGGQLLPETNPAEDMFYDWKVWSEIVIVAPLDDVARKSRE
jgi:hypothetical protein